VTVLLVVLLALALVASFGARKGAPSPASKPARAASKRKSPSPYWLLGAVLLGLVLLRFGVNWIVVAAGMVAALLRGLLPLLRLLPLLEGVRRAASSRASGPGSGRGGSGAAPGSASSSSPGGGRRPERMTRREALQVFGLDENATRDDVQREYRRLMRQVHPDLGGSGYLAAKINEAKDVLS
jgi:DnaJ family protein C protein 19